MKSKVHTKDLIRAKAVLAIKIPNLKDPYKKEISGLSIKAEAWIKRNPHVYGLFKRFALELIKEDKPFSISLLTERVRWEYHFYDDDLTFKVSNNHRAYIARKLAHELPKLRHLMRFRPVTKWENIYDAEYETD